MRGVQRTQACSVPKRWFRSRVSSHIIERLTIGHVASSPPLGVLLTLKFFATYCLSSRAANRTATGDVIRKMRRHHHASRLIPLRDRDTLTLVLVCITIVCIAVAVLLLFS